jgi:tetratricopeptide (TPR) repeat protein
MDIEHIQEIAIALKDAANNGRLEQAEQFADHLISILPHKDMASQDLQYAEYHALALSVLARAQYAKGEYHSALDLYSEALQFSLIIEKQNQIADLYDAIGVIYMALAEYDTALEYFDKAAVLYGGIEPAPLHLASVMMHKGIVYSYLKNDNQSLEYYKHALGIAEQHKHNSTILNIMGNIGLYYYETYQYSQALEYLYKVLQGYTEQNNKPMLANTLGNIANILLELNEYEQAMEYTLQALELHKELRMNTEAVNDLANAGMQYAVPTSPLFNTNMAEDYLLKALAESNDMDLKRSKCLIALELSKLYKLSEQYSQALEYHELYHSLDNEIRNEEIQKTALQYEQNRILREKEKQIAIEKARYLATEELLNNVLPPAIAQKILNGNPVMAEKFEHVTILFADITGFTKISQFITAEQLVHGLDALFSAFDKLAEKYQLEKIKTIGDAYMVAAGVP